MNPNELGPIKQQIVPSQVALPELGRFAGVSALPVVVALTVAINSCMLPGPDHLQMIRF